MKKIILCIDDVALIRILYQRIFETHGYQVVVASSGKEGLAALDRYPVDCILLDYEMPAMDGADVVRRLQQRPAPPPVILVSGSEVPDELLAQVDAFFEKPARVEDLRRCVEKVIAAAARDFTMAKRSAPRRRLEVEWSLIPAQPQTASPGHQLSKSG
jgi:CheY-like chemotaxis protein